MKKLYRNYFVLFVCLFSISLEAKEVNKKTAEKVAINAFAGLNNNRNAPDFQVKEILTVKSEEETSFYIINFKPTGFIIISASDAAVPILGSSTESNFSFENLPPQLAYLFDCYKTQIKEIEKQKNAQSEEIKQKWDKYLGTVVASPNRLKSISTLPTQVDQILNTKWGQNLGWNRYCPANDSGPGGHTLAGCVAVAMAQILKKWGCQANETGYYSYYHPHPYYATKYGLLEADFSGANYLWNLMVDFPSDEYNAKLIRDCGVSISMEYGPKSSEAYMSDAQAALSTFFGFKNTSNYVYRTSVMNGKIF